MERLRCGQLGAHKTCVGFAQSSLPSGCPVAHSVSRSFCSALCVSAIRFIVEVRSGSSISSA